MEENKVLTVALNIGKSMVKYGAEINRVEETIIRICKHFGFERVEVFSMVSMISVTARNLSDNTAITQTRRIYNYTADFERLDELNSLSRALCSGSVDLDEAAVRYKQINSSRKKFHPSVLIGSIIAAAAFAVFFGGSWKDCICAGVIAVPVYFVNTFITHRRMNRLFYTALNSCLAGALALTATHFGFAASAESVMIGDIMLLIPGLMLINSFREFFCGDIVSGLTRLLDSIMVALAIACGFAIPILTFSHFGW